ncbi:MAG: hypothetical protein DWQ10_09555 [Calditrichaeota bacterium]|nr:MAG: hypothetical protein DWQ10_09555 [Calditrichota bacterium]
MSMDCREFENYLQDYLDNETSSSVSQAIEEHLNQCTSCRCELDAYKKASLLVQLRNVPQPEENYWETTYDKIQDEMSASILQMSPNAQSPEAVKQDDGLPEHINWPKRISYFISIAALVVFMITGYWVSNEIAEKPDEEFSTVIVVEPEWRVMTANQSLYENFAPDADFSKFSGAAMGVISPVSQGLQAEAFLK